MLGMRLCVEVARMCFVGRERVCVFATRRNEGGAAVSMFLVQRYGAAIAVFECRRKKKFFSSFKIQDSSTATWNMEHGN